MSEINLPPINVGWRYTRACATKGCTGYRGETNPNALRTRKTQRTQTELHCCHSKLTHLAPTNEALRPTWVPQVEQLHLAFPSGMHSVLWPLPHPAAPASGANCYMYPLLSLYCLSKHRSVLSDPSYLTSSPRSLRTQCVTMPLPSEPMMLDRCTL